MTINSQAVLLARQARGLSQKDLADIAGISQSKLSKIEVGQQDVSPDILDKFSEILCFPKSFFMQSLVAFTATATPFNYRKKASLKIKDQSRIEAEANIIRLQIRELLDSVEYPSSFERIDLKDYDSNPILVAKAVRAAWGIPKGPIQNLVQILEDRGIIVIWMDFGGNEVSGFTIQDGSDHPIIFINRNNPGDRDRFTLAHELGHILMHRIFTLDSEEQADKFASEFLMPKDEISSSLYNINIEGLAHLKLIWQSSMASLLYRAKSVGAISKFQSDKLWRQMSSLGYRTNEPITLNVPKEKPTIIKEIISAYMADLNFSKLDLCEKLKVFESDFDRQFGENFKPFRIVVGRGSKKAAV